MNRSPAATVSIGLDHFARGDDELALAQGERLLRRNLMGYTARAPAHVVAFGIGGVGDMDAAWWTVASSRSSVDTA